MHRQDPLQIGHADTNTKNSHKTASTKAYNKFTISQSMRDFFNISIKNNNCKNNYNKNYYILCCPWSRKTEGTNRRYQQKVPTEGTNRRYQQKVPTEGTSRRYLHQEQHLHYSKIHTLFSIEIKLLLFIEH